MFRVHALPSASFAPLFGLDDAALHARHARRVVADTFPGFPCRLSLEDAHPGETLLLVHHTHHAVDSPYRDAGPIFVREHAVTATPLPQEIPQLFRHRLLSLRAYSENGLNMFKADVIPGQALEDAIAEAFTDPLIAYLHVHFARPGCYAALVTRH